MSRSRVYTPRDYRWIVNALADAEIRFSDRAVFLPCECQLFRGALLADERLLVFLSQRFGPWGVQVHLQGPEIVAAEVAPCFGGPRHELRVWQRGHLYRFSDLDEVDALKVAAVLRGQRVAVSPSPPAPPPAPARPASPPPPPPPRRAPPPAPTPSRARKVA